MTGREFLWYLIIGAISAVLSLFVVCTLPRAVAGIVMAAAFGTIGGAVYRERRRARGH